MTLKTNLSRRHFMAHTAGVAAALATRPAFAQDTTLDILSHRVHQAVLGEDGGESLLADWKVENGVALQYTTFDSNPLQDRLFREASLPKTEYGVGYMIDNRPTSEIASLFEPLRPWQERDPIEDFEDIAAGLREGMTVDGNLVGIPVRHATQGLFYNAALLAEAGIDGPPETLEELVEQANALTFTSESGTPVTGMVLASDLALFPVMFARAFGGDFITQEFELVPDPAAMEAGLNVLRAMFESGALPRSYATTRNDDQVTWMQQGRAAFTVLPFARHAQLNDPEQSNYPGEIKAVAFPGSKSLEGPMASIVEAWAMTIPANHPDKETAWSYIREVSSKRVTTGMALNGNGPVRVSTYSEPELIERNPLAAVEAAVLADAGGGVSALP